MIDQISEGSRRIDAPLEGDGMRVMWATALRRLGAGTALLAGLLPLGALAQSAPALWTSAGCSAGGCHLNPVQFGGLIPFGDDTLFASLSAWKSRVGKAGSNGTMQNFANNDNTGAGGYTDGQRQQIFDYLLNARNPVVTVSGTTFAATDVGQQSATTRTVTITNFRGEDLNFTASLSNTTDFDFTTSCPASPRRVAAQSSCTITVTFTPTAGTATTRTSNLTIDYTSGTQYVPLTRTVSAIAGSSFSGTVNPPAFSFTANAGPFNGRFSTPATSTDFNFGRLRNTGSATMSLTNLARVSGSSEFTLSPADLVNRPLACTTTQQLGDNAFCDVWVRYTPTAAGAASATFRFSDNASGAPHDRTINATALQPIISPTSATLSGFSAQQGATSAAQSVVLTNDSGGGSTMAFTFNADPKLAGAKSGANPSDFTVTTPGCNSSAGATIATGGSCTISVTFTPPLGATPGVERSATLTVSTDANNNGGALVVTLRGTPTLLPDPDAASPASDFPDTVIGQSSSPTTRQVVITNPRAHTVSYAYTTPTDFQTVSQTCSSGAPPTVPGNGGTCTITFAFTPGLTGGETRRVAPFDITFTPFAGDPVPTTRSATLAGRALMPLGAPASLTPTAGVGLPATASTLLSNRSTSAITLSALSFSGAAAADYALDATNGCGVGASIPSGGSCPLVIRFNPSAGGTRNATLTITHNALGSPQAITLNGSATQGAIQLSSFALTFPSTALNATAVQSITVGNNGTQPLNFSAFDLAGAAAGDYTRSGDCAVGTPLAVNGQCTVTLTFHPAALGARNASLTIQSDASNGPATVTLTGTGVPIPAPVVALTPGSLDFGTQTVGNPYPTRTIRLSNAGNADLHTTSVVVEGGAFATASTCPATLTPGAGCDVQIQFAPLVANTDYTGALRVVSDAAGSPHTAALTGRGSVATLAAVTWSPLVAQFDFGTVSSGALSAAQTATLLNQGPGGVTLTVLNAVGPDASAFAITGGSCAVGGTLFEGQSCTVIVQFAPSQAGVRHAQLQVASSGSFPPTLALTGTGLGGPAPDLALSVATMDLGATRVGAQSAPGEITLSSTGSGSLRVTALDVVGPFAVQPKTCPALPFTLPAGATCTLGVSFVPQAQGGAAGSLKVTTSASATPAEVALSGQGEAAPELSSGGCSIADGDTLTDPTLWALAALAAALLWHRRRAARAGSSRR